MSTISALGNSVLPSPLASRNPSIAHMYPPANSNPDEDWDHELVMADHRGRAGQVEEVLPNSVAHSPLFALPIEIRQRIWQNCVITDGRQIDWIPPTPCVLNLAPQLLRTCKIIYAEAAPILYSQNQLAFTHPTDANIFVRALSSPSHSRLIQYLNVHVQAKDTRLWMKYISSSEEIRSLKCDFPNLKELTIRYKSVRWNHNAPIDTNLRTWAEDRHLEELLDSLRHLYYPAETSLSNPLNMNEGQIATLYAYESGPEAYRLKDIPDARVRTMLKELIEVRKRVRVRIICMCRVHMTQFRALTAPVESPDDFDRMEAVELPGQQIAPTTHFAPPRLIAIPVREGEEFDAFTAIDFKGPAARQPDILLGGAMAHVARTPFLYRDRIMLALEVYALP